MSADIPKSKKDSQAPKVELYADTTDPFINLIYKKLRNKNKKLMKIKETETKAKSGEIKITPEQQQMVSSKAGLIAEMDELQANINMYQEAFPENPVFQGGAKKKAGKQAKAVA
jgi:hypothetical protein